LAFCSVVTFSTADTVGSARLSAAQPFAASEMTGWHAPAPGASAALPGRQPRRRRVGFAHQAIECRLAGLGHWFVRHSQSGEWTAGFAGVLFGLKRHKQCLGGVFPHCALKSFASPTSAHLYQRGADAYLATLLGADSETALRWFVLVVALLLDPVAVLPLLAASSARR
jgi:hypothetical protein